jgi:type II secretory pathway pseudopilin PulG
VAELLVVLGIIATISTVTVPAAIAEVDNHRAAAAARYMSARLQRTRLEAVVRSRSVAIRFSRGAGSHYVFAVYVDGNGNGVTADDIARGIDRPISPAESLTDAFPGIDFGTLPGLPPVDAGATSPGNDPIRLGASDSAAFSATGTSTSGSLYLRGRTVQYVVRLFGETGKTRALRFDARARQWKPL